MIQIEDLKKDELLNVYHKAFNFKHDHADYVETRMSDARKYSLAPEGIAPSGSDIYKPELWKGIHWLWFHKYFARDV